MRLRKSSESNPMTTEPDYFVRLKDIERGPSKLMVIIAIVVAIEIMAGAAWLWIVPRRRTRSSGAGHS